MNESRPSLSVIDPISPAMDRVKAILFNPFDLRKWFVIGFCAWLAQLGEGGAHGGFNYGGGHRGGGGGGNVQNELEHAWDYTVNHLYWIIPVAATVLIFVLAVWALIVWLSSRGRFMFLHCVALDRAEVVAPWHEYAREGNSLFVFRLVLGLIGWCVAAALVIVGGAATAFMVSQDRATVAGVLTAVAAVLLLIAFLIAFAVIAKFTKDLVVPIMYLRRRTCRESWSELLRLMSGRKPEMALYILFQIALAIVLGVLVIAVVIVTCCLAGCLFALPYIGAVALLPVLMFKQCYALHYLAQFGRDWNVFPESATPKPATDPSLGGGSDATA